MRFYFSLRRFEFFLLYLTASNSVPLRYNQSRVYPIALSVNDSIQLLFLRKTVKSIDVALVVCHEALFATHTYYAEALEESRKSIAKYYYDSFGIFADFHVSYSTMNAPPIVGAKRIKWVVISALGRPVLYPLYFRGILSSSWLFSQEPKLN